MKIGFFGGSFNPPTNAHIFLAKQALKECKLDKVVFVPVGDFYDKKELVSGEHRYNMLKIACKGLKNIEITDLELKVKEKLHAIDAFKLIEKEYPKTEKYFIMGADNFINIMQWKDSKELIEKYRYIVLERENINIEKHISEKQKNKVYIINNKDYNACSSSKFRDDYRKEKRYNKEIIPDGVIDYIIENNLFLI